MSEQVIYTGSSSAECVKLKQRLARYIAEGTGGCLLWTGSKTTNGYAQINIKRKMHRVHRVVYELVRGGIPDGLQIDHLCRVRHCVNPHHLEAVTQRTNILRGNGLSAQHARKTHCKHGHEFTEENTYHRPDAPRQRTCLICKRATKKRYEVRHRNA